MGKTWLSAWLVVGVVMAGFVLTGAGVAARADDDEVEPVGGVPAVKGWKKTIVAEGLEHPWGMAFLPNGDLLITERPGRVRRVREGRLLDAPLGGVPEVFAQNQGGLLDIALHPDFESNQLVYLTYAAGTEQENATRLARAKLADDRLNDLEVIFEATPKKSEGQHFGSRIVWLADGTLLMSIGDGGNPPLQIDGTLARDHGQRLDSTLGSIVRLNDDGSVPSDNPLTNVQGARPEIYSFGHRNIQGMARDPESDLVWVNEHGPLGGDELNLIRPGRNYAWPLATFGADYRTGERFTQLKTLPEGEAPKVVWTPAQAPSGLMVYTGDRFPDWKGQLLSGGLVTGEIRLIAIDGERVGQQRTLKLERRVRDVKQGPDGNVYVLTDHDDGELFRLEPADTLR
jgi:aldose sugar dehydrogenase